MIKSRLVEYIEMLYVIVNRDTIHIYNMYYSFPLYFHRYHTHQTLLNNQ